MSPEFVCLMANLEKKIKESNSMREALENPNWKCATDKKMVALICFGIWELSDLPLGRKPVACKWVFKIKYNARDSVERYKARLVAKRFNQCEDIYFHETFSLVVKFVTIRFVTALALYNNWNLFQLC